MTDAAGDPPRPARPDASGDPQRPATTDLKPTIAPQLSTATRRALAIAAAVVTIGLVGLAAASGNPLATRPYLPPRGPGEPPGTPDPRPTGTGVPLLLPERPWLIWLLTGFLVLCAVALVALLVIIVVRLLTGRRSTLIRRRVLEPDELLALTAPWTDIDLLGRERNLSDAAAQGLAALAAGSDVRASVINAWLHLEEAAATAGTPRRNNDAPADLVSRLLADHDVRPRRLEALAELYRRARFSPAPLDEDDRRDAQRALGDVRDDLTGRAGAANGAVPTRPGEGRPARWT